MTDSDAPTGASSTPVHTHARNRMLFRSVVWPLLRSLLAMAGFDGVKILGANGYFVDYGHGGNEAQDGRRRLALEVVDAGWCGRWACGCRPAAVSFTTEPSTRARAGATRHEPAQRPRRDLSYRRLIIDSRETCCHVESLFLISSHISQ